MSQSEIAFLALGLVIGVVLGAVFVQVARSRPARRREVRLTIAPHSVSTRRSTTLAAPNGARPDGPIPGSPDADALSDGAMAAPVAVAVAVAEAGAVQEVAPTPPVVEAPLAVVSETPVPGPETSAPSPDAGAPLSATPAPSPEASTPRQVRTPVPAVPPSIPSTAVGIPIVRSAGRASGPGMPEPAAPMAAVAVGAAAVSLATAATVTRPGRSTNADATPAPYIRPPDHHPVSVISATVLTPEALPPPAPARPVAADQRLPAVDAQPAETSRGHVASDPCTEERSLLAEQCGLADAARDGARRAADALREARRSYDVLRERVDQARETADPRHIAAAKEQLHATFRVASDAAEGPDEAEAAARAWLNDINRLNATAREAQRLVELGGAELRAQLPALDRLGLEADAARISLQTAEAACRATREALARCEERGLEEAAADAAVPVVPDEPHPFAHIWPTQEPTLSVQAPAGDESLEGLPLIVRILRNDRDARDILVATLAGSDPDATREWHLRVAKLVDAIYARAIEDGYLDLPEDDPFWHLFSIRETREVIIALSALGFRFDGLGGFADEHVPATRDLSMAIGYAGLDPMRIRSWPREAELAGLLSLATVAADEWLAVQARDLSLGRMVDALGTRAGDLAEVWNAWGRVRPALLAT